MQLNIVMLGPPAAGKGTQARILAREHGVPHLSTGDMLRQAVAAGTPLGIQAKALIEAGALVSDEIMIGLVAEQLARRDMRLGCVLDGFPRTVNQAEALDRLLASRPPLIVIEIVVPVSVLVRRAAARRICRQCGSNAPPEAVVCACGGDLAVRPDDNEPVVRQRLQVYERETAPLVEYYRIRPTYQPVDGNQSPDEVAAAIRHAVSVAVEAALYTLRHR